MTFGVLNIDKPLHCTSHDVVARVRKVFNLKKVGHAGTLDPLATGVLPVCVGDATRLIEYFPDDKRYQAWVTFGQSTTTWDAEGDVIQQTSAQALTSDALKALLPQFAGVIRQQVPPHAAVHVNGKKLYEYARKGIAVELPVRDAEIFKITLVDFDSTQKDHPVAILEIHCASGTYVRSIAQALGEACGYGAFLSGLVRTRHGLFDIQDSVSLDTLMSANHPGQYLLSPSAFLPFEPIALTTEQAEKILHGMKLLPQELEDRVFNNRLYHLTYQDQLVGMAKGEDTGRLKPVKVFMSRFPKEVLSP